MKPEIWLLIVVMAVELVILWGTLKTKAFQDLVSKRGSTDLPPQRRFRAQHKAKGRVIAKDEAREADIEAERLAKMGWDATSNSP